MVVKVISKQNAEEIKTLEQELRAVPYTFNRPIPNRKVVELIQQIQEADRNAGFTIGGVAKYIIDYVMEERRKNRKLRKAQRIGVSAQRFNDLEKVPVKEL